MRKWYRAFEYKKQRYGYELYLFNSTKIFDILKELKKYVDDGYNREL